MNGTFLSPFPARLVVFFGMVALSGCGGVSSSHASRENIVPVQLQDFPAQNWLLFNNKVFLWKENMTPDDGSAALAVTDEIDRLDGEAILFGRKHAELDKKLADARTEPERSEAQTKITKLEDQQRINFEAGQKQVERMTQISVWCNHPPETVSFQNRPDGTVTAVIGNWAPDPDDEPMTFSTFPAEPGLKPTIGRVTYEPLGGVYQFDLYVYADKAQTKLRETYNFRVGRIKLDDQVRSLFGGEIFRTRVVNGKTETRYGMAKFVDKNN